MDSTRRTVLSTLGAGVGWLGLPDSARAQAVHATGASPRIVRAGDATQLWVLGILLTIKADSDVTGGGYVITEDFVLPGHGVPLHVHTREDEAMYVVEGEVNITIGDLQRTATPGDVAHMPRNVPHRFQNLSDKPARLVLMFSPGGIEGLFREIGKPVRDPHEAPPPITADDARRAREAAERYGGKWL